MIVYYGSPNGLGQTNAKQQPESSLENPNHIIKINRKFSQGCTLFCLLIPLSPLQLISYHFPSLSTHSSHNGLFVLIAHFYLGYSMGLEHYYLRTQGLLLPIIRALLKWQLVFRDTVFGHFIHLSLPGSLISSIIPL